MQSKEKYPKERRKTATTSDMITPKAYDGFWKWRIAAKDPLLPVE
jgi:hypothetical protein